jgi:hypothetical protein
MLLILVVVAALVVIAAGIVAGRAGAPAVGDSPAPPAVGDSPAPPAVGDTPAPPAVGDTPAPPATHQTHQWARWLRWAALAAAAVAAVALAPAVARDSGWFATVLLGVPVVLAAIPVGLDWLTGRVWGGVEWLAAILAMGWAVLLALGIGLAFVPAALLQLAAAATAMAPGRTERVGPAK